jgi:hypothetical protein
MYEEDRRGNLSTCSKGQNLECLRYVAKNNLYKYKGDVSLSFYPSFFFFLANLSYAESETFNKILLL